MKEKQSLTEIARKTRIWLKVVQCTGNFPEAASEAR
jgi:hypothetical protein